MPGRGRAVHHPGRSLAKWGYFADVFDAASLASNFWA